MAKHGALTTPRVVRDAPSTMAWKPDIGPFPGWRDVPTKQAGLRQPWT
jgi:hypothetical protein